MKVYIKIASIMGALSVILGAFGAHALKTRLPESSLASYKTGVLYMMVTSVVLLILALYNQKQQNKVLSTTFWLFLVGILFFSGSIFLLSTQSITGISFAWLGPITPVGGLLLILGWLNLLRY